MIILLSLRSCKHLLLILAANLSRLAVETYVDSNYTSIANTCLKMNKKIRLIQIFFCLNLENRVYTLPKKTRDIYLYLPYRMLNIFPTVAVFGNLDLTTGQAERKIAFYPTQAVSNKDGMITFRNGIAFDAKKVMIRLGQQEEASKTFYSDTKYQ